MKTLPKDFKFTKYIFEGGTRYDIHFHGENIAYAFTKTLIDTKTGEKKLWLDGLLVIPEFQGKGIATYLMRKVEQANKGNTIHLRARPYKNKSMPTKALVEFYTKRGYKLFAPGNYMMKKIKK